MDKSNQKLQTALPVKLNSRLQNETNDVTVTPSIFIYSLCCGCCNSFVLSNMGGVFALEEQQRTTLKAFLADHMLCFGPDLLRQEFS